MVKEGHCTALRYKVGYFLSKLYSICSYLSLFFLFESLLFLEVVVCSIRKITAPVTTNLVKKSVSTKYFSRNCSSAYIE